MLTLVIGPPDSGKSCMAEDLVLGFGERKRYYIATMKVMDDEGRRRISRHQKQRSDKGFVTIEEETDIIKTAGLMEEPENAVVLLECVANLTGNMMYDIPYLAKLCRSGSDGEKEFAHVVVKNITELSEKVSELVVVSAQYEPSAEDDEDTALYKKLLEMVNIILERRAHTVHHTGITPAGDKD